MTTIFIRFADTKELIVFAHNFDTDDNSTFLTLVNKLMIENRLLNHTISNENNSDNLNSIEYIKNIDNILEEILISEDTFTIDSDQFYNNTVVALVVANLADEVLRNYGHAFGVPSNLMLSMNFSGLTGTLTNPSNISDMNMGSSHMAHQQMTTNSTMIDNSSYHNALEISDRMIELYSTELKGSFSNITHINKAKSDLSDSLYDLEKDIELKESPYRIMQDVHGKVHPNLQIAFNLTLRT